jgi:MYXO-CTERM domain-containing protein
MENGHLVGRRIEAATGAMVDAGEPLGLYSVNGLNRPVGLGSNGDGWLVAWQDSGQAKVRAGRISAAGAGLDGTTGFALPATTTANRPLVAFGGGAYLVVWGDGDPASPSPMLRGERVDGTTGALMDATAIAIGSTGPPAAPGYAVGFGQSSFVVTDNGTARRISPSTGAVSAPFAVSSSGPGETDLSFDGSAFLQTYPRLDGSGYSATRFREDGTDLDPADLALSVSADGTAYDGVPTAGIPGRFLVGLDRMIASPEIGSVRAVTAVIQSCGDGGCSPADGGASDLPIVPGAPANLPPGCATDGPSDAGAEAAPADATSMDSSAPGDAAAADSGASDATGDGAADATGASDGPAPPSDGAGSGSTADGRDGPASDGRDGRAADAGPGGGGCGCEASGPASAPSWIALAVGLAFLHARRSRRR